MKTTPKRRTLLVALFLATLLASPARAGGPPRPAVPPPPACAAVLSRSFWTPIEWAMGSQRRMLQVATVGMCLALYIIAWKK
jgi:hypothetical protein